MSSMNEVVKYYAERADEYQSTVGYARAEYAVAVAPIKARYQLALEGQDVLEIACGPGYWTEAVAATAHSIVATDVDPHLVSLVGSRLSQLSNVRCQVADAYSLEGLKGPFTAAFSQHWWSHIPKSRISSFLTNLHSKLEPGALVLFLDALPYDYRRSRRHDENGDLLEERALRNGKTFEVIKNFPNRGEVLSALSGIAEDVSYRQFRSEEYWTVSYRTKRPVRGH